MFRRFELCFELSGGCGLWIELSHPTPASPKYILKPDSNPTPIVLAISFKMHPYISIRGYFIPSLGLYVIPSVRYAFVNKTNEKRIIGI